MQCTKIQSKPELFPFRAGTMKRICFYYGGQVEEIYILLLLLQ